MTNFINDDWNGEWLSPMASDGFMLTSHCGLQCEPAVIRALKVSFCHCFFVPAYVVTHDPVRSSAPCACSRPRRAVSCPTIADPFC